MVKINNKLTPREILDEYIPEIPSKWWGFIGHILLKVASSGKKVKYFYHFDKKDYKNKQVILIADHSSRDNFYYVLNGYNICSPNIVMGYQNFFDKNLFKIFLKFGVIPKFLYAPDVRTSKNIIRLLKQGASLMFFPEGIQSNVGTTQPMNPASLKLLKKAGVDVILCSSRGAYLNKPRTSENYRIGPMEFHYQILFTKEELEKLSIDEMYDKYLKEFKFNDFIWNKEHQYKYIGKTPNITTFDSLLYYCPKCHHEFTLSTDHEDMVCKTCGNRIHMDSSYNITPKTTNDYLPYKRVDEWFSDQRIQVINEINNDYDNYSLTIECYLMELHYDKLAKDKFYRNGKGFITINKKGIYYQGTRNDKPYEKFLDIKLLPSVSYSPNRFIEAFYEYDWYGFEPIDNKQIIPKITLIIETLHNKIDPIWKKYYDDVFNNEFYK